MLFRVRREQSVLTIQWPWNAYIPNFHHVWITTEPKSDFWPRHCVSKHSIQSLYIMIIIIFSCMLAAIQAYRISNNSIRACHILCIHLLGNMSTAFRWIDSVLAYLFIGRTISIYILICVVLIYYYILNNACSYERLVSEGANSRTGSEIPQ